MEKSPRAQLHDHEYVKNAERGRDHNEEITCHDHLGMVVNECQPALLWIGRSHWSANAQVLRHGSRRNPDAELQFQLVGDALLAPRRIFGGNLPNESSKVLR